MATNDHLSDNISACMIHSEDLMCLFERDMFSKDEALERLRQAGYKRYPDADIPSLDQLASVIIPYINRYVATVSLSSNTNDEYVIKSMTNGCVDVSHASARTVNALINMRLLYERGGKIRHIKPTQLLAMFPDLALVVHDVLFRPISPRAITKGMSSVFEQDGVRYLNSYTGPRWSRDEMRESFERDLAQAEDPDATAGPRVSFFINHLYNVFCNRDANVFYWILRYFIIKFQEPYVKHTTSPIVIGEEGAGKGITFECLLLMHGSHYKIFKQEEMRANFNALSERALFVYVEEMQMNRKDMNLMKDLVTKKEVLIEQKYIPKKVRLNYCDYLFSSNSQRPVALDGRSRRFCMFRSSARYSVSGERQNASDYFDTFAEHMGLVKGRETYEGVRALAHYFLEFDVKALEKELDLRPVNEELPRTSIASVNQLSEMDSIAFYWFHVLKRAYTLRIETIAHNPDLLEQMHVLNEDMSERWIRIVPRPLVYADYEQVMRMEWMKRRRTQPIENEASFWEKTQKILSIHEQQPLVCQKDGSSISFINLSTRDACIHHFERYTGIDFLRICELTGYYMEEPLKAEEQEEAVRPRKRRREIVQYEPQPDGNLRREVVHSYDPWENAFVYTDPFANNDLPDIFIPEDMEINL